MADKNLKNNLFVNQDERSSRFVVDLASDFAKDSVSNFNKKEEEADSFIDKIAEFSLAKFWLKIKSYFFMAGGRINGAISGAKDPRQVMPTVIFKSANKARKIYKEAKVSGELKIGRKTIENKEVKLGFLKTWGEEKLKNFEELVFFSLVKFIFILFAKIISGFYKFCLKIGWLAVFALRFIYLVLFKLAKATGWGIDKVLNLFKAAGSCFIKFNNLIFYYFKKVFTGFWTVKIKERGESKVEIEVLELEPAPIVRQTIFKPVFSFAVVLLVLVIPFKAFSFYKNYNLGKIEGQVLGASESAFNNLKAASEAASSLDLRRASDNFSQAGDNFFQAQKSLEEINGLFFTLANLAPNEKIKLAGQSKKILAAGQTASELASNLSLAMDSLFASQEDMAVIINNFSIYGGRALEDAKNLNKEIDKINLNSIPGEYRFQFEFLKTKAEFLENGLGQFIGLVDNLKVFLGLNQDKRYLLVFQNNAELRASGGFIGSFALIDFRDGEIKNIETPGGGSYDTEGGLKELVTAPEPLWLVNPLWHFWDANWWPDWPTTAKKLMWFYEKSDGPTVDGVISFTPTVMERLLAAIGPIDMTKDYGVVVDSRNFWLTTQKIAEEKLTPEQVQAGVKHEPKRIIGDLMNEIMRELPKRLDKEVLLNLLKAVESNLSEKHILFYFTDQDLENDFSDRGWTGETKATDWDYLFVINTNIAGGKSDRKIRETIDHQAEITPDGRIYNIVKIKREHTGEKRELFTGVRNVDWLRVYVPEGSELMEAHGFEQPDKIYFENPDESWQIDPLISETEGQAKTDEESGTKIYSEAGKTVFANWSMVDPGQTAEIYLKYKLPFKLEKKAKQPDIWEKIKRLINPSQKDLFVYSFYAQKQPGSINSRINTSLNLPANFGVVWKYPEGAGINLNGWQIEADLATDKYWAVLLEEK